MSVYTLTPDVYSPNSPTVVLIHVYPPSSSRCGPKKLESWQRAKAGSKHAKAKAKNVAEEKRLYKP